MIQGLSLVGSPSGPGIWWAWGAASECSAMATIVPVGSPPVPRSITPAMPTARAFGVRDGTDGGTLPYRTNSGRVCSVFVTASTPEHSELLAELVEALHALGLDARAEDDALVLDGQRLVLSLVARAHPTPADLAELVRGGRSGPTAVVADRLSEAGRRVLREAGWGFLDRRGHLRLWTTGLRLDCPVPGEGAPRPTGGNVWTTVGLEVALHALVRHDEPVTARRLAPVLGRSVGATHEMIGRFVADGLVGRRTHRPLLPELFWETAANWPDDDWTALAAPIEVVAERVDGTDLIRVDERAATLGGARIAAAGALPARCYVRSPAALRKLRGLAERDAPTRCWVRTAPIGWLPLNDEHPPDDEHPWAVAHPVLCAVRLAADPARGREIVEDWGVVPGAAPDPTEPATDPDGAADPAAGQGTAT